MDHAMQEWDSIIAMLHFSMKMQWYANEPTSALAKTVHLSLSPMLFLERINIPRILIYKAYSVTCYESRHETSSEDLCALFISLSNTVNDLLLSSKLFNHSMVTHILCIAHPFSVKWEHKH